MFQKMLATLGIGAVKIDTKLVTSELTAGDVISGVVDVFGGKVKQEIDTIYISLYTSYIREGGSQRMDRAQIARYKVCDTFEIEAGQRKEIPFHFNLPHTSPITAGNTLVWIETEADLKLGIDQKDKDYIEVLPTDLAYRVLKSIEALGFRRYNADCEKAPKTMRTPLPFIQQFEYHPSDSIYKKQLQELELTFLNQSENHVEVLFELDRRASSNENLFAETLDQEDTHVVLMFNRDNIETAQTEIAKMIEENTA